jgi:colanic acid biosynthesis glycosyl transferase WcaI
MLVKFRRKGVPEQKLLYFPNAISLAKAATPPTRGEFRRRHNLPEEKFLAVYAGNMGVKQGLDQLIEAAQLVRDPRVHILMCGDGAQRDVLAEQIRALSLPNIAMLPLQHGADYIALLNDADVCFITQQSGSGNSFFPSKLLGLLAQSKPVITVADPESELAEAVQEGRFGQNIAPGQPAEIAQVLDAMATDQTALSAYGASGNLYVQQFEKTHVFESFLRELQSL